MAIKCVLATRQTHHHLIGISGNSQYGHRERQPPRRLTYIRMISLLSCRCEFSPASGRKKRDPVSVYTLLQHMPVPGL